MKKQLLFAMTVLTINAYAQIPAAGLVGHYPFTGNANDISGSGNNGTNNGATLTTDRFGNSNSAYSFNGTSSFISIPNVAQTGNSARSIFCWVKFSSTNPNCVVATGSTLANGNSFNLVVGYITNLGVMGTNNDFYPANNATINDNVWHFIGTTFDGAGSIKTYVDGNLDNSGTFTFNTADQINYIGKSNDIASENYFDGIIDDVLLYNRALTSTEVLQVFNGTSCTIPTSGLVGQFPFTGNANDISGNGNNGTNNGATLTTDRFGNSNSAYLFNGISSFISIPNVAQTGNSARSIFCWVKFSSTNPNCVVATGNTLANGNSFNLVVGYITNLGVMGTNNDFYPANNATINDNVWHFIGTTFDGAGSLKTYVDGNLDNSGTFTFNTAGQINYIGKSNDLASENYFNGIIDDVLLYNRALTTTEVSEVFCNSVITGINTQIADKSHILIYPNPASNYFNIQGNELNEIKIYDINGKLVFSNKLNNASSASVDCSNVEQGFYFICITDSKSNITNKKLIIK